MGLWLAWAWVLVWPGQAWAQGTPELVAVPQLLGPLNDYAQVAGGEASAITQMLVRLHADTGVQFVVLTWPNLGDEPIAPFANRVMERWQLGTPGSDLGLLLLIVPGERSTRFEVGYGLEGVLPDATCKRLLADVLAPKGPDGGKLTGESLLRTVAAVDTLVRRQQELGLLPKATPAQATSAGAPPWLPWALVGGLLAIFVLTRVLMAAMPRYGDRSLMPTARGFSRAGRPRAAVSGGFFRLLFELVLALLSGGGRGGPPQGGGGYSGGGGRSGGGGSSDRY